MDKISSVESDSVKSDSRGLSLSAYMCLCGAKDLLSRHDNEEKKEKVAEDNFHKNEPNSEASEKSKNGDADGKPRLGYDKRQMTKKDAAMFKLVDIAEKAIDERYSKALYYFEKTWDVIEKVKVGLEEKYKTEGKWNFSEKEEYYNKLVAKQAEIEKHVGKLEERKKQSMDAYISTAKVDHALDRAEKLTNKQFVYNLAVATSQAMNQAGVDCTRGMEDFVNNVLKVVIEGKL